MTLAQSGLADLQQRLWHAVRHARSNESMCAAVVSSGALSSEARIDIYRRMYWCRQVDALHESFPALAGALGDERFTSLVCRYLASRPSESPLLERLGEGLARFMSEVDDDSFPGSSTLWAEVARLEWAQTCALLSPDPPRRTTLAELPLERFAETTLRLAPSVHRCRVTAAAYEIVRRASSRPLTRLDGAAVEGSARRLEQTVLVWRPRFVVRERLLDDDEASALERVAEGAALEEVVLAFEGKAEPARRAATCVARWVDDELVTELSVRGGGE
ncbi:MAG: putative DNA-binding domain-containing protein [Deltaproteobacteria bacterium]|nr:putative DNA-binding domain-containing protein [Deltaproteobacteria bacterium]